MAKKTHILHTLGSLNQGGIETWLMHVLRHIDRDRFQMDFVVQTHDPSHYDEEVRSLGSRIISCTNPTRFVRYCQKLRGIIREYGPYDVVHSHTSSSAVVLRVAHQMGIPIRIVHSHIDGPSQWSKGGLHRRAFLLLTKNWIFRYATHGLACSKKAAASRFGKGWEGDSRWQVLNYSIDMEPFRNSIDKHSLRLELGIPEGARVVGHVGRFHPQKNHTFLLEIAAEAIHKHTNLVFILVGDGDLRQAIERKVDKLEIGENIRFLGTRPDVPRLMCAAMDAFLFPSHYEGLGLVLIEAQAAGLPCVISDVVPAEADQLPDMIQRVSLSEPASHWGNAISHAASQPGRIDRTACLEVLEKGFYNIRCAVKKLENLYK